MIIGFTGTREGMNDYQLSQLRDGLRWIIWRHGITEARHGDCVGGDRQFHKMCVALTLVPRIVIHPPINPKHRAYCGNTIRHHDVRVIEMTPQDYHVRDHAMVIAVDYLFVGPRSNTEELRSGTWATYRFAKYKANKPFHILRRAI